MDDNNSILPPPKRVRSSFCLATKQWKVRSDISESRSMMRSPSLSKSKSEVSGQSGQYIDDKSYVVWPKSLQAREPVLPLPPSSPYAKR